jgi:hypothetical protein
MTQVLLKRGLKANLPATATVGEPLVTTDTNELYIGTGTGVAKVTDVNFATSAPSDTTRLWVDTTNNVMKRHNGTTWVILAPEAAAASFASLTGVPSDSTALQSALDGKADVTALNTEITARTSAVSTVAADLLTEITARTSAVSTVASDLLIEITARTSAVSTVQAAIDTEVTARKAAIADLVGTAPATLDTLQELATALQADEGTLSTLLTSVGDKATSAALDIEITARTSADSTLTSNLNTEITARTSADSTLQAALNTEITARMSAIVTYTASTGVTKSVNDFQLDPTVAGDGLVFTTGVLSVGTVDGGAF